VGIGFSGAGVIVKEPRSRDILRDIFKELNSIKWIEKIRISSYKTGDTL
jgi:hypothetical protein